MPETVVMVFSIQLEHRGFHWASAGNKYVSHQISIFYIAEVVIQTVLKLRMLGQGFRDIHMPHTSSLQSESHVSTARSASRRMQCLRVICVVFRHESHGWGLGIQNASLQN